MKLLVIAGPPSSGKTSLVKQIVKKMRHEMKIAFFKIDVVKAFEDVELNKEFGILTRKFCSGDLCPD
ncbi:MAG: AAA family ATPase, partial [Desulfotomaculaceae bacterium]|nr:AAA family ATPase [Desulfotomaculaceae bacterium]